MPSRRFRPKRAESPGATIAAVIIGVALIAGVSIGAYFLLRGRAPTMTQREPPAGAGLNVGQLAPDISGEDIDGVPFKLSDYRGKVVVLDFWGHW